MKHETNAYKSGMRAYAHGLLLSLTLTVSAFMLVWAYLQTDRELFSRGWMIAFLVILAGAQILVQAIYFLHMSAAKTARWTLGSAVFTLFVLTTIVLGSIWVMQNLHYNMMTDMPEGASGHHSGSDITEHMQDEEAITRE